MREISKKLTLTLSLVVFVFIVMSVSFIMLGCFISVLQLLGKFGNTRSGLSFTVYPLSIILLICIFLGSALAALFSKTALKPIRRVIEAMRQVTKGNFTVHVDRQTSGEMQELADSFNTMTEELRSIEMLRSDFVNHFSHEFKTPIVSIRGFAKLLRDGEPTETDKKEYLDIIISESQRLADLSTNILNLTRYETTRILSDRTYFRLDEQIRRVIVISEPKWSAKNLSVDVDLDDVNYFGSEDLCYQVWLNLIDNAIKFSEKGGHIQVTMKLSGKMITVIVEDDGIGMDEQTINRIFDKFYQADSSHSSAGNGLGLSIVKRIIELSEGSVEVKSKQGAGSRFTVNLPLLVQTKE